MSFTAGAQPDVSGMAAICLEVASAVCLRWQAKQKSNSAISCRVVPEETKGVKRVQRCCRRDARGYHDTPLVVICPHVESWCLTRHHGCRLVILMWRILNPHVQHRKAVRFFQECFYKRLWATVWAPFNMCEFAFNLFILPNIPTSRHLASAQGG